MKDVRAIAVPVVMLVCCLALITASEMTIIASTAAATPGISIVACLLAGLSVVVAQLIRRLRVRREQAQLDGGFDVAVWVVGTALIAATVFGALRLALSDATGPDSAVRAGGFGLGIGLFLLLMASVRRVARLGSGPGRGRRRARGVSATRRPSP